MNIQKMEKQLGKRIKSSFHEELADGELWSAAVLLHAAACLEEGDYDGLTYALADLDATARCEVAE